MGRLTLSPGPNPDSVLSADRTVLTVPSDWTLLPPGDAALTRRVKADGAHWAVTEKRGRRLFSRGFMRRRRRLRAFEQISRLKMKVKWLKNKSAQLG